MSRHTTRGREWFSHQSLNVGPVEDRSERQSQTDAILDVGQQTGGEDSHFFRKTTSADDSELLRHVGHRRPLETGLSWATQHMATSEGEAGVGGQRNYHDGLHAAAVERIRLENEDGPPAAEHLERCQARRCLQRRGTLRRVSRIATERGGFIGKLAESEA